MSSFTIQTKQPLLQNLFSACGVLTDEATFEVTEQGLGFRGMDPSHIAMIDVAIPSTEFDKFEGTAKFGVRVDEALKVVKRFGKEDEITLTEADSRLIMSNGLKTYKLGLIEAHTSGTPLPKLNFTFKVDTLRKELVSVVGDIAAVAENVTIEVKGKIVFFGRGDRGEATVELPPAYAVKRLTDDETAKASYSLDYLTKIVKGTDSDTATLEFASKMPVCLTMGYVKFFLAPRMED